MKGLPPWCFRQRVLMVVIGVCLAVTHVPAQASPQLADNHPDVYTVVMDDTLWDISQTFLANPWLWPDIWHVNPQIKNPHLIYPGDKIRLVYIDGEPRLTIQQRNVAFRPNEKELPNGTIKLSPRIRASKLEEAIPAIPLDIVHAFLSRNCVMTAKEMNKAPYVIMGQEERILLGEGDKLYARGKLDRSLGNYSVYRLGKPLRHPITRERLGYQGIGIGKVTAAAFGDQVSTFRITDSFEEIRLGDRLMAQPPTPIHSMFYPKPPINANLFAKVVNINNDLKRAGRLEVVTISLGKREGVEVGNVFSVFSKSVRVKDPIKGGSVTLPEEQIGLLMVFSTFEKVSYALVMEASRPVEIGASLYHPEADLDDRNALLAAIENAHAVEKKRQCKPRRYRNGKRIQRCDSAPKGDTWIVNALRDPKPESTDKTDDVTLQPVSTRPSDATELPNLEK